MTEYHNDKPIDGSQEAPDLLNRSTFAKNLSEIIALDKDDDCLTVSLEGEWGYGKTSVINLVKSELNNRSDNPIVVEFNPWLSGKPEVLVQEFLIQLSAQLNIQDKSKHAKEAATKLIAYSSLFSVAKLVPGAEPWASVLQGIFSRSGRATKKLAELKKLDLLSQKNGVEEAIEKIDSPIVVIIDDIDRLMPEEAFQVLRLVKSVANFSGTSFLLAFDSEYLTSVLKKNNIENTTEYINKIVQLRVPLPVISEKNMRQLVNVEFDNLSDDNLTDRFKGDRDRLSLLYFRYCKHLIKNPRELKRLFNHLKFVLKKVEGQVCFADLFSLSLIATKSAHIYEHIKKSPEAYVGEAYGGGLNYESAKEVIASYKKERDSLFEYCSMKERKLLTGLLEELFPLIKNKDDIFSVSTSNADKYGRVAARERLYVAMHYSTPEEYVSDNDIVKFIRGEVERLDFVNSIFDKDCHNRFLNLMLNYSDRCHGNEFDVLISIYDVLFESRQLKASQESNLGMFDDDPLRITKWVTEKVIDSSENRYQLLHDVLSRVENAAISADIFHIVKTQHKDENHSEPWVSEEEMAVLQEVFHQSAVESIRQRLFYESYLESHIFYGLKHSDKDVTRDFLNSILEQPNGVVRIAEILCYSGSDSTNGMYANIDNETFGELLDLNRLRREALEVAYEELPMRTAAVFKSFRDGKSYYLRDGAVASKR